jgi:hypothetical protein
VNQSELRLDGPVVVIQSPDDPGDMGEPRQWTEGDTSYLVVPSFDRWRDDGEELFDRKTVADFLTKGVAILDRSQNEYRNAQALVHRLQMELASAKERLALAQPAYERDRELLMEFMAQVRQDWSRPPKSPDSSL